MPTLQNRRSSPSYTATHPPHVRPREAPLPPVPIRGVSPSGSSAPALRAPCEDGSLLPLLSSTYRAELRPTKAPGRFLGFAPRVPPAVPLTCTVAEYVHLTAGVSKPGKKDLFRTAWP